MHARRGRGRDPLRTPIRLRRLARLPGPAPPRHPGDGREREAIALAAPDSIWWEFDGSCSTARAVLRVRAGDRFWIVLRYDDDEVYPVSHYESQARLDETAAFWDRWVSRIRYHGPYRAEVERSALVLKLLFYDPTGAVVAAPTTSLPEEIGGVRNWDYRYTWLRDASFTLYALHVLGQYDEATRFMDYLKRVTRKSADHLQIMYGISGERVLTEQELPHLEGTAARGPCGSATARTTRSSSTSTARSWRRRSSGTRTTR